MSFLHTFNNPVTDGSTPKSPLTLIGGKLYGTTSAGGGGLNDGALISFDPSNNSVGLLHGFQGFGNSDGSDPVSSLTAVGSVLYGTTESGGGIGNFGTIFSYDTATSTYTVLHKFTGNISDGANPVAGLTLVGNTLYGTTENGGINSNLGTLFSIGTDGSNYQVVHTFTVNDGTDPAGDLLAIGNVLYGTTSSGGNQSGGTIFSIAVPEPATCRLALVGMGVLGFVIVRRRSNPAAVVS